MVCHGVLEGPDRADSLLFFCPLYRRGRRRRERLAGAESGSPKCPLCEQPAAGRGSGSGSSARFENAPRGRYLGVLRPLAGREEFPTGTAPEGRLTTSVQSGPAGAVNTTPGLATGEQ